MSALGDAALAYAARGWHVFPLVSRDKVPFKGSNGVDDATTDTATIRRWWAHRPDANIGIACGPSQFTVLDVDGDAGRESLRTLKADFGISDRTVTALTTHGQHLYYRANGFHVGNDSTGKLGEGLHVRGIGGYVVAPQSVHPSGQEYAWDAAFGPGDVDMLPFPDVLAARLTERAASPTAPASEPGIIREGARNGTLTSMAGSMRRRGMEEEAMLAALLVQNAKCCRPPLSESEVKAIAKSIARPEYAPEPSGPRRFFTLTQVRDAFGSVSWTWPAYIPSGHVTMIVAEQGKGKSRLCAHLMGCMLGVVASWPDGAPCSVTMKRILLLETEEFRGVYAERLAKLGVPDDAVVLPGVDATDLPQLRRDVADIEALATETECGAVFVDSLSGGHCEDENSAIMRGILQPLVGLAGRLQIPVVVVHHVRKKSAFEGAKLTLDRVRGSSAITQFCRSVLGLYRLNDDPTSPVRVESLKSSFCRPPAPFGFTIGEDGLTFCEAPQEERAATATDRASEFLRVRLARQPMRYSELIARGEEEGISKNALYQAKARLGLVVVNGLWSLPAGDPQE